MEISRMQLQESQATVRAQAGNMEPVIALDFQ